MTDSARVTLLEKAFKKQFQAQPQLVVCAPGRVNLIGEHTDYNEGYVFPVAIDRDMLIAAAPNNSDTIKVYSLDYGATESFTIGSGANIEKNKDNAWADYLKAVIATLKKRGHNVSGFNAVLSGNVPQGAGLSSSAAYEVAVVTLCSAIDDLGITAKDAALIAQQAENEFVGMQCGIMDQFISALGEEDSALMIDCRSLDFRAVPLNLAAKDYAIVITHSGVRRGLVTSEYNARRSECTEGVNALAKALGRPLNSLRDVELADFDRHHGVLSNKVSRRCKHVISENKRVVDAVGALEASDLEKFGRLMNESHSSLKDDFEVSCPEIDRLVDLSQAHPGVLGARITGGGFGGCTVAVMANSAIESYREKLIPEYERMTRKKAEVYICVATEGARRLN